MSSLARRLERLEQQAQARNERADMPADLLTDDELAAIALGCPGAKASEVTDAALQAIASTAQQERKQHHG